MSNDSVDDSANRHGPERLRVYHLALELCDQVEALLRVARCSVSRADQARRSSESVVLNIAEGSAHFSPGKKIYHYQIALGEAAECIAAMSLMRRRNPHIDIRLPRQTAELVSAMLVALIRTQEHRRRNESR
jgi:four helix bundle protein